MVTGVPLPATTLAGLKPVIFGDTLKLIVLVPVPASFVTMSGPVIAPSGTVAFTDTALTSVAGAVTLPPNVTDTLPAKFAPLIVSTVPTGPASGANVVTFGGWITTRSVAACAPPSTVVTLGLPVRIPTGTTNWIDVDVFPRIAPSRDHARRTEPRDLRRHLERGRARAGTRLVRDHERPGDRPRRHGRLHRHGAHQRRQRRHVAAERHRHPPRAARP